MEEQTGYDAQSGEWGVQNSSSEVQQRSPRHCKRTAKACCKAKQKISQAYHSQHSLCLLGLPARCPQDSAVKILGWAVHLWRPIFLVACLRVSFPC